jgi:hypothetical protein
MNAEHSRNIILAKTPAAQLGFQVPQPHDAQPPRTFCANVAHMMQSTQFSFLPKKRDTEAYRSILEDIFEWALQGFSRFAGTASRSPKRKSLLKPYNSVLGKIWKLYQETGDSSLVDAYEMVCTSLRLNVPAPFYLAGQESAGERQRREANEKLLLAYRVASKLEPKRPYSMIEARLKKGFCRSPKAIPMRISDIQRRLREKKWEVAWVLRSQLEAFKAESSRQKHPERMVASRSRKWGLLRPSRLGGNPFTSLGNQEEQFVAELALLVLSHQVCYAELGDLYLDKLNKHSLTRTLVHRLERLGYNAMLEQKAA